MGVYRGATFDTVNDKGSNVCVCVSMCVCARVCFYEDVGGKGCRGEGLKMCISKKQEMKVVKGLESVAMLLHLIIGLFLVHY